MGSIRVARCDDGGLLTDWRMGFSGYGVCTREGEPTVRGEGRRCPRTNSSSHARRPVPSEMGGHARRSDRRAARRVGVRGSELGRGWRPGGMLIDLGVGAVVAVLGASCTPKTASRPTATTCSAYSASR